jgi:hypothetical protein
MALAQTARRSMVSGFSIIAAALIALAAPRTAAIAIGPHTARQLILGAPATRNLLFIFWSTLHPEPIARK